MAVARVEETEMIENSWNGLALGWAERNASMISLLLSLPYAAPIFVDNSSLVMENAVGLSMPVTNSLSTLPTRRGTFADSCGAAGSQICCGITLPSTTGCQPNSLPRRRKFTGGALGERGGIRLCCAVVAASSSLSVGTICN